MIFCGLTDQGRVAPYFPPPLFVRVPISCPVEETKTCIVALVRVLVASIRSVRLRESYSARWIATVSSAGVTVKVATREIPFNEAVTVALKEDETEVVLTAKFAPVAPPQGR